MKRQFVVWTGFNKNRFGKKEGKVHKSLTEQWIFDRINIWRNHTWQSILRQKYKDWVYFMCCDLAAKDITDIGFAQIKDSRFHVVYPGKCHNLMTKISSGYDEMVNVRIDSDDMYHPNALRELSKNIESDYDWYVWKNGYAYQYDFARELRQYEPKRTGPFFAHRYKDVSEWVANDVFNEGQHHRVSKKKHKVLSGGSIIVGIHGQNSTTAWSTGCFKRIIAGWEKVEVLKGFGL